jgi:DNA modification methylase
VFREVRRVLRDDGTLWMNMGDGYAAQQGNGFNTHACTGGTNRVQQMQAEHGDIRVTTGLKPKNLVGMPWRLAFALQADGWFLRSDIIWAKPNPMPESVTDRPTKAHEYVFLLSKAARYFYDADAVREPQSENTHSRGTKWLRGDMVKVAEAGSGTKNNRSFQAAMADLPPDAGRNLRSVWSIHSAPFPDAHFATFPPALASRCIQAGSSERGCCAACGAPWVRQTETEFVQLATRRDSRKAIQPGADMADINSRGVMGYNQTRTLGWHPACACEAPAVPCTVLDPFAGTGTVGAVAEQLGRHSVLIELSPAYVKIADRRTAQLGLFTQGATA